MVTVGTVLVPVEHGLCWKRTKKQATLRGFSQHLDGSVDTNMDRHLSFVMSQGAVFLSGNTNLVLKNYREKKTT